MKLTSFISRHFYISQLSPEKIPIICFFQPVLVFFPLFELTHLISAQRSDGVFLLEAD